jgi:hypothetical protein
VKAGADVVVAVGGDGTVTEVAGALIGTPAALGIVPCGSGNGLARHLGISLRPAAALAVLAGGHARRVDAGEANGRCFFCAMGTGFDTAVLGSFERLARRGFAAYFLAAARAFSGYRCEAYGLRIGAGEAEVRPALFVTVANSDQLGNNARIAPGARVDDGRLDFGVVREDSLAPEHKRWMLGKVGYSVFAASHFWKGCRIVDDLIRKAPIAELLPGGQFSTNWQQWLTKSGLRARVIARASSFTDLVRAVHVGHAAAVLPELAAVEFDSKKIEQRPIAALSSRKMVLIANARSLDRVGFTNGSAAKLANLLQHSFPTLKKP